MIAFVQTDRRGEANGCFSSTSLLPHLIMLRKRLEHACCDYIIQNLCCQIHKTSYWQEIPWFYDPRIPVTLFTRTFLLIPTIPQVHMSLD
jgi:hypothetical protein